MKKAFSTVLFCLMLAFPIISPMQAQTVSVSELPVTTAYAQDFDPFKNIGVNEQGVNIGTSPSEEMDFKSILEKYKSVLYFVAGLIVITSFTMLFYNLYRLSVSGDNDRKRQSAISGIMICGIGIALLGSFSIIAGLVFKLFQ